MTIYAVFQNFNIHDIFLDAIDSSAVKMIKNLLLKLILGNTIPCVY